MKMNSTEIREQAQNIAHEIQGLQIAMMHLVNAAMGVHPEDEIKAAKAHLRITIEILQGIAMRID